MYKQTVIVSNKNGIHARPSAEIVQEALKYKSDIRITNVKEDIVANAKAVLEVLQLAACYGVELTIEASGVDGEEAVNKVTDKIKEFAVREEGA